MMAAEEAQSKSEEYEPTRDLEDSIGWYNMGTNLMKEGKHDEALSSFEKAIGGCPPDEIELKIKPTSLGAMHFTMQLDILRA